MGGIWIGATDIGHEGEWTDTFDNPLNYSNWSPNQPDNLLNQQHCVWINFEKVGNWDDIDCNYSGGHIHHYACQSLRMTVISKDNPPYPPTAEMIPVLMTNDSNQFIFHPSALFLWLLLRLLGL